MPKDKMKEFIKTYKLPMAMAIGLACWPLVVFLSPDEDTGEAGSEGKRAAHRYTRGKADKNHTGGERATNRTSGNHNGRFSNRPQAVRAPVPTDNAIISRGTQTPHRAAPGNRQAVVPARAAGNSLATILNASFSARTNIRGLVAAMESFRTSNALSEQDREAANNYLQSDRPEGMTPGQHHWVVDELITTLRADGADNAALTRTLANLYQDTSRHTIVRDYALQHLGHLSNEGGDTGLIQQTLQSAVQEKQGTLAGTALLAMHNSTFNVQHSGALAIAKDESYDLRSRITALQVSGKQQNADAIPFATETARDTTQPAALRLAAIATLADTKATGQQQLLTQLSNSRDQRIRTAANAALQRLTR